MTQTIFSLFNVMISWLFTVSYIVNKLTDYKGDMLKGDIGLGDIGDIALLQRWYWVRHAVVCSGMRSFIYL